MFASMHTDEFPSEPQYKLKHSTKVIIFNLLTVFSFIYVRAFRLCSTLRKKKNVWIELLEVEGRKDHSAPLVFTKHLCACPSYHKDQRDLVNPFSCSYHSLIEFFSKKDWYRQRETALEYCNRDRDYWTVERDWIQLHWNKR